MQVAVFRVPCDNGLNELPVIKIGTSSSVILIPFHFRFLSSYQLKPKSIYLPNLRWCSSLSHVTHIFDGALGIQRIQTSFITVSSIVLTVHHNTM
jgi:hypothetical protein